MCMRTRYASHTGMPKCPDLSRCLSGRSHLEQLLLEEQRVTDQAAQVRLGGLGGKMSWKRRRLGKGI